MTTTETTETLQARVDISADILDLDDTQIHVLPFHLSPGQAAGLDRLINELAGLTVQLDVLGDEENPVTGVLDSIGSRLCRILILRREPV